MFGGPQSVMGLIISRHFKEKHPDIIIPKASVVISQTYMVNDYPEELLSEIEGLVNDNFMPIMEKYGFLKNPASIASQVVKSKTETQKQAPEKRLRKRIPIKK